jgi:NCS1 family nucleobase:cation symporter-1
VHQRTWNKWHITALWVGMSICVPTYTLGGVLTAYFGLSVGEALLAILLANLIVLIPLTLNAFPAPSTASLPGAAALVVRHLRLQRAVPDPRRGGVWLVRYPDDVRRAGHPPVPRLGVRRLEGAGRHRRSDRLHDLLGAEPVGGAAGAESIKWLETLSAPLLVAVGIGLLLWAMPHMSMTELLANRPSARKAPAWSVISRRADCHGRLLGHVVAEHPDFSRYAKARRTRSSGRSSACR